VFDCCLVKDYSLTYLLIMLCCLKNDIVISDAGAMNCKTRHSTSLQNASYRISLA